MEVNTLDHDIPPHRVESRQDLPSERITTRGGRKIGVSAQFRDEYTAILRKTSAYSIPYSIWAPVVARPKSEVCRAPDRETVPTP